MQPGSPGFPVSQHWFQPRLVASPEQERLCQHSVKVMAVAPETPVQ
jgi:hypothetical protein